MCALDDSSESNTHAFAVTALGGETADVTTRRPRPAPIARSAFAGFRFPPDVIVLAARWYLRFGLSYRDVEELLTERGIQVDHVTIYRWVLRFTPLLADAARPCRHAVGQRWFVDETYGRGSTPLPSQPSSPANGALAAAASTARCRLCRNSPTGFASRSSSMIPILRQLRNNHPNSAPNGTQPTTTPRSDARSTSSVPELVRARPSPRR
jgi:hypothetical protein